jgi:hypothetical protein
MPPDIMLGSPSEDQIDNFLNSMELISKFLGTKSRNFCSEVYLPSKEEISHKIVKSPKKSSVFIMVYPFSTESLQLHICEESDSIFP